METFQLQKLKSSHLASLAIKTVLMKMVIWNRKLRRKLFISLTSHRESHPCCPPLDFLQHVHQNQRTVITCWRCSSDSGKFIDVHCLSIWRYTWMTSLLFIIPLKNVSSTSSIRSITLTRWWFTIFIRRWRWPTIRRRSLMHTQLTAANQFPPYWYTLLSFLRRSSL